HGDKEAGARSDMALDSLAAAKRPEEKPVQDAKAGVAGPVSETVQTQTLTTNAQPQNQQAQQNLQAQQSQLSQQEISGPNPSKQRELSKKPKSESPAHPLAAPPPATPAPAAAFSDSADLRMAAAISPSVIATPDKKTLWRADHTGMIEF